MPPNPSPPPPFPPTLPPPLAPCVAQWSGDALFVDDFSGRNPQGGVANDYQNTPYFNPGTWHSAVGGLIAASEQVPIAPRGDGVAKGTDPCTNTNGPQHGIPNVCNGQQLGFDSQLVVPASGSGSDFYARFSGTRHNGDWRFTESQFIEIVLYLNSTGYFSYTSIHQVQPQDRWMLTKSTTELDAEITQQFGAPHPYPLSPNLAMLDSLTIQYIVGSNDNGGDKPDVTTYKPDGLEAYPRRRENLFLYAVNETNDVQCKYTLWDMFEYQDGRIAPPSSEWPSGVDYKRLWANGTNFVAVHITPTDTDPMLAVPTWSTENDTFANDARPSIHYDPPVLWRDCLARSTRFAILSPRGTDVLDNYAVSRIEMRFTRTNETNIAANPEVCPPSPPPPSPPPRPPVPPHPPPSPPPPRYANAQTPFLDMHSLRATTHTYTHYSLESESDSSSSDSDSDPSSSAASGMSSGGTHGCLQMA